MKRQPYPWLPTPAEVATAPALAILSGLLLTLDVVSVALVAAHHELQSTTDGRDASTSTVARAADEVILAAQTLAQAICCYRRALLRPRRA